MNSKKKEREYLHQLEDMNEEDTDTTGGEDDDDMKAVDDMIIKASRELEHVVEENKQLLEKLDKSKYHSNKQDPTFNGNEEQNNNIDNSDVLKQLEEAEEQAKATANIIYKLKTRVGELLKKDELTEEETKELDSKNMQLKQSMKSLEENTIKIQKLIEKTNIINTKDSNSMRCFLNSPRATFNTAEEKIIFKIPPCANKKSDGVSGKCSCCSENIRQIPPNVPTFAKKLCQSYSMQEKLAAENASLESIRFKLQEELLNKDQSLECLERELSNLQGEMKLISKENSLLNEKLAKLQEREDLTMNNNHQKSSSGDFKIREYSDNIYQLEKQLTDIESDVKCLQEEICAVQSEREHLEKHRKIMCKTRPCVPQHLRNPFRTMEGIAFYKGSPLQPGQVPDQYSEEYNILKNNVKLKLTEIVALKTDYERLRNLTNEAEELKTVTENNTKECEILMNTLKAENKITAEQEQQLAAAKNRLKRAQESLKDQKTSLTDQKKQLEDVANKCLEVQQKLEDHKYQINCQVRVSDGDGFNKGVQIISNLQDKLGEIII